MPGGPSPLAMSPRDVLPCPMFHRMSRPAVITPLQLAAEHLVVHNAQTLAWQCEVTRIAAPTGAESTRGQWMAAQFASIGWSDVTIDTVGNVIARRPAAPRASMRAPAVWCCAHLDTVFDIAAPEVHQVGTKLTGPGIGDNGRGLAALLAIGHAMEQVPLTTPHDIVLACTVGEEGLGDLRGMKQLLHDASPSPLAVIAIDGAGDDRIVNVALGSTRWRITFRGPGGHSWADHGVANPLHAAASAAAMLHVVALPREPRTTLTVARMSGGESINSVPRSAWFEVDMRSLSASVLADLERTLRQVVARAERTENARRLHESPSLTSEIAQLGSRPCGALAHDASLVRIAQQATRECGGTPRLAIASTDASLPISMGIPAIAIGAGGRGGGTHTPDEWYDDTGGVAGLQRALRIVAGAAGCRS